MTGPRLLITGIGAIAPNGCGTEAYWRALCAGDSGLRAITRFDTSDYPCRVAGEVRDFDVADHVPRRLAVQTDRWTHFALAAAAMALADADYDPAARPPDRTAVFTASSSGGNEFGQREIQSLWSEGPRSVGPYQSIAWFYAASTGQLSIRHGAKGPCGVISAEGAGGLDALAGGRRILRRDGADAVLTGGTEAPLSPYALACQVNGGRLAGSDDADRAYLPFTANARGHVPGEGGALLLVEPAAAAERRGAPRHYAELAGYAATHEGHQENVASDGGPLAAAITNALADAGIAPDDIDAVFADGAGLPHLDLAEANALRAALPPDVPVTVPKTMTGRLYAGGGALDVATAALALFHGLLPPTTLPEGEAVADLRLVRRATRLPLRHVLVVARGQGGFNAAVVLRAAGSAANTPAAAAA